MRNIKIGAYLLVGFVPYCMALLATFTVIKTPRLRKYFFDRIDKGANEAYQQFEKQYQKRRQRTNLGGYTKIIKYLIRGYYYLILMDSGEPGPPMKGPASDSYKQRYQECALGIINIILNKES